MSTESIRVKPELNVETKSSSYDQINAMLIAWLMLFGFVFSVLFFIWLAPMVDFSGREGEPSLPIPPIEKKLDEAGDEIEPSVGEFPEVETPQLENTLEAVTSAVSSVPGALGKRSGRPLPPVIIKDCPEGGRIPEYKRWVVNFSASDINTYATMLSYFKIEIGIVSASLPDIFRLNDPAGANSVRQSSREAEKDSVYFIHKNQQFRAWDKTISKQAGVATNDTLSVQFYPDGTRQLMRDAEFAALQGTGKEVVDVKNTFFKVVSDGSGYKFEVQEILYR